MIRYLYSFRHVDANYYLKPTFNDLAPEDAKVNCLRDMTIHAPDYVKTGAQSMEFCYVGQFDDDTGLLLSVDPVVLATQDDIVNALRKGVADVPGASANFRK